MSKILFQIKNNKLIVEERKRIKSQEKSLINTNIISRDELLFSDDYISENPKLINNFIKEIIINYHLDTLVIKNFNITILILDVLKNISEIKNLYLLDEEIVNYNICKAIINSNSINFVSLYNIPTFLLELLDKEQIKVQSRAEILFESNFMKNNMLENFSSLYYKTSIYLNFPLSKKDEEDFITFLNINKYLKAIYINKLNKNDLENVIDILDSFKIKNIKIWIEQNINDIELIDYLKKLNRKNAKTNGIKFKIDYSDEYLASNLMSQIHISTIKTCIFISLFLVSSIVLYVFYLNYSSMKKVEAIQDDINKVIAAKKEDKDEEDDITQNDNLNVNPEVYDNKVIRDEYKALLEMNPDTVGWLKVNNTEVDYPVVQTKDNDYYLKHNFKNEKDYNGWIFMDYRANAITLSKNTIIFGHNMYYSGVMFGTLYKVKHASWYKNKENQIIEFDTVYNDYKWQIFSIYVIPNTNDYLIANFSTDEKFQSYIDMVIDRSFYDFNIPVALDDKILTLFTCSGNNASNRLVIHAVLIED